MGGESVEIENETLSDIGSRISGEPGASIQYGIPDKVLVVLDKITHVEAL